MADYHDTVTLNIGDNHSILHWQKTTVSGIFLLWQRYSHTRVIPSAAAKKANKPSATRWPAADLLEELDGVGTGVPVGTAPTPFVIGPLSVVTAGSLEPRAFAADTYASKVFPLFGGLIAPTIPRPQWPVVLQNHQMGC